jgi:uncharacterized protein (DUF305 family)
VHQGGFVTFRWRFATLLLCIVPTTVPATPQGSPSPASKAEWYEFAADVKAMHMAMSPVGPSGNSDTDFVRLMLPHHQAAIDMARTQLMYGTDPQMRRLAQEIITDQQSEIELMQLWLKQHDVHR